MAEEDSQSLEEYLVLKGPVMEKWLKQATFNDSIAVKNPKH